MPDSIEAGQAEKLQGSPVERREDPELLTGEATFTDDMEPRGTVHMAVLRSQYGHARIESIDTSAAEELDGVLAVYTADDVAASEAPGQIEPIWLLPDLKRPPYPMLARDKARYQGQPVAVAVADDRYRASDAVDAIDVTYDRLEAVTGAREATDEDAPTIHEEAPENVAAEWDVGDEEATDEAFENADRTVSVDLVNQRLLPTAMEPRVTLANYRPSADELVVHMGTQCPHLHRRFMADMLDFPEQKMRVIAPEVGGGFGSKDSAHPDEALTAWCSLQLERPVKWQATRTEAYASTGHGRGQETTAEIAVDEDGSIQALRVETYGDLGGYLSTWGPLMPAHGYALMLPGQYDVENVYCEVTEVFTNATPTEPYRGAGRPEASYVIERLATLAARELDMDPVEFRRKNFISRDDFPHETATGLLYDSGDYDKTLDRAIEMADLEALREKQADLREEGRYLGIGISCYNESCGYGPSEIIGQIGGQLGLYENGVVRFHPSGSVTVYCGTSGHGQGHETTYAQIVADELGVDYDDIEVIEGDTDEVPMGMGTYGSRSVSVGGSAIVEASREVVEKAGTIAAHHLEVSEEDLEFEDGEFQITGAPARSMTIQEVAREAYLAHDLPDGTSPGLEATNFYDPENLVFPFGTHIVVVEVDPDTGEVDIERYVAVDDCGNQINPKIVEGQVHGAIAQGLGQGLFEGVEYDENGTLLTGSMQDYTLPKAFQVPEYETDHTVTPSPHNPLGAKGIGEAGTIAAPPAVVNAVTDALQPFGIDHIDMPLTDETVWQAIQHATAEPGGAD
ncbi:xanthine dehydrogenase family protein molybdopterin-binding subunit [Haloplanus rubicundus]|uniref:Xanthine dehydrogenase family protein molybdopterin-binding subunit n=1 Tax=Haloplanus rubicundus TaxID=1547898 RepID=A0A345EAF3_9EURY|nr:xanthine dehydrogenase family protein molybdopterin-binding subunit [Haloplanus rubicundus]AXG09175.1 xanthine dehydrogenase family protein molybdopterin-binding subunit [Haloplanus rubicundus]